MNTKLARTLALFAAFAVAACGDDDPVSTGDALSEAEAAALSGIVLGAAFQVTSTVATSPTTVDGPQAAPFTYSTEIETSVECSGGGTIGLNGNATINGDDETMEFTIAYSATSTYNECTEFAPETEQQFTIGGSLSFTANADYEAGEGEEFGSLNSTGSFNGSISWSSDDGRSGTCAVALTSTTSANGESISATTTGSFCGTSINETFNYGVGVTT